MTVLTRMHLNPARRGARALLGSPQAMHAALMAAFPPGERDSDAQGRILWRVDCHAEHPALLYLLSPVKPDLTHVVEQAGWPTTATWESRDYSPLLERLADGQEWAFRLTANPVRRIRQEGASRSEVKAHVTADQQATWLLTRTGPWGFMIPPTATDGQPALLVRDRRSWAFPRKGATVSLATATFDGILRVTDRQALRQALTGGLGRAKAYGCGLLTLAPPRVDAPLATTR